MPTVARTLEDATKHAWDLYAGRLAGLEGEEYEAAEQRAWSELQETLSGLRGGEAPLPAPPVG